MHARTHAAAAALSLPPSLRGGFHFSAAPAGHGTALSWLRMEEHRAATISFVTLLSPPTKQDHPLVWVVLTPCREGELERRTAFRLVAAAGRGDLASGEGGGGPAPLAPGHSGALPVQLLHGPQRSPLSVPAASSRKPQGAKNAWRGLGGGAPGMQWRLWQGHGGEGGLSAMHWSG